MDDTAPCHRAVMIDDFFEMENIQLMSWPANSPDLNPIEHVWVMLGRQIAALSHPPSSVTKQKSALQKAWNRLSRQLTYSSSHSKYAKSLCSVPGCQSLAKYPGRQLPSRSFFSTLHRRLCETGSFNVHKLDTCRQRTTRTVDAEDRVLQELERNPSTSTRVVSRETHIPQATVWRIAHDEGLHPYHLQRVQALELGDYNKRMDFARWFLHESNADRNFAEHSVYLTLLQEVLPEMLNDVPMPIRQRIRFQHDGAPAHFSIDTPLRNKLLVRHRRQVYLTDPQPVPSYLNRSIIVQNSQQLPEYGPWGTWTESSECSRSCGGGIAYQDRICLDVR
ncbi:uncharacterized protein TNCV_2972491 [Trichonephila clavipes]|nr:uncharacterized protein TNCV_2972491 [Trichonephila clavipes]